MIKNPGHFGFLSHPLTSGPAFVVTCHVCREPSGWRTAGERAASRHLTPCGGGSAGTGLSQGTRDVCPPSAPLALTEACALGSSKGSKENSTREPLRSHCK